MDIDKLIYKLNNNAKYKIAIFINDEYDKSYKYKIKYKLNLNEFKNFVHVNKTNNIKLNYDNILDENIIYVAVYKRDSNITCDNIIFDLNLINLNSLLGIHNQEILKMLNLEKYNYYFNSEQGIKIFKNINIYKKILNKIPINNQANFLVRGSTILFTIGTTIGGGDIDYMLYFKNNESEIHNIISELSDNIYEYILDGNILKDNNLWYIIKDKNYSSHMTYVFNDEWVKNCNATKIEDFFFNSKFFYYYYGIKFISVYAQVERLKKRYRKACITDLLALKIFNNVDIKLNCIKNYTQTRNRLKFIDYNFYVNRLKNVSIYLKDWHNVDMNVSKLKKIIKYCKILNITKDEKYVNNKNFILKFFNENIKSDPFVNFDKYINKLLSFYLEKYCSDRNLVTRLSNLKFVNLFNKIEKKKIDIYIFNFTIQYFSDNMFEYINNFSKKNSIIIIHTLNYNYWKSFLKKNNTYKMFINNKLYCNVNKINSNKFHYYLNNKINDNKTQITIDLYNLINKFKDNNFKMIELISFFDSPISKYNLLSYEASILNSYLTIIFKKIDKN